MINLFDNEQSEILSDLIIDAVDQNKEDWYVEAEIQSRMIFALIEKMNRLESYADLIRLAAKVEDL